MTLKIALLADSTLDTLPALVDARLDVETEWYVAPWGRAAGMLKDGKSPLYGFGPHLVFVDDDIPGMFSRRLLEIPVFWIQEEEEYYGGGLWVRANDVGHHVLLCHNWLANHLASDDIHDPRYWYSAKMRYSPKAQELLADLYARAINAYLGRRKKVLVVDLDNTLWGGVLGEVGKHGIGLSDDGPDLAFQDAQREILRYHEEGILLAICSKNNEHEALECLAEHPQMVLRPDHFAAWRINWQDKATNLKALAKELNVGLDSFVFFDDSPHERELIRQTLPEVTVVEWGKDPAYLPRFLARLPHFDTLELTDEDKKRSAMYQAEKKRTAAKEGKSVEDYLKSLDIHVTVRRATEYDVKRVAQLSQRTNQFNMTGVRFGEAQVAPDKTWVCETRDRYGDYGTVGAAILVDEWHLWLSCRALGRGVEDAFFAGLVRLTGGVSLRWRNTGRNAVAQEFLERRLHKNRDWIDCPDWITLEVK